MNVNKLFWRIHTVANFSLPTNLMFISWRAFIESISFANFVTKSWLIPFDLNYWSMLLSNISNLNSLSSQLSVDLIKYKVLKIISINSAQNVNKRGVKILNE